MTGWQPLFESPLSYQKPGEGGGGPPAGAPPMPRANTMLRAPSMVAPPSPRADVPLHPPTVRAVSAMSAEHLSALAAELERAAGGDDGMRRFVRQACERSAAAWQQRVTAMLSASGSSGATANISNMSMLDRRTSENTDSARESFGDEYYGDALSHCEW